VLAGVAWCCMAMHTVFRMLPNAHHTHAQNQPAPLAVLDHGKFRPPRVLVLTGTVMNMRAFVKAHCRNCVCTPRCWPLQNAHNMHVSTHSHTTILQRSLCVNVASACKHALAHNNLATLSVRERGFYGHQVCLRLRPLRLPCAHVCLCVLSPPCALVYMTTVETVCAHCTAVRE
jgi:hypothetical protein